MRRLVVTEVDDKGKRVVVVIEGEHTCPTFNPACFACHRAAYEIDRRPEPPPIRHDYPPEARMTFVGKGPHEVMSAGRGHSHRMMSQWDRFKKERI